MAEGISLAEQGSIAKEFLTGLLASMNIQAEITVKELDEETVELSVNASPPTELGVLVGPRGTTLQALQEVTRTVVQAKSPSRTDRILVDVAQYRERRVAALGRFAQQVATEVVDTGEERALEPMSAADRKAVHDALVREPECRHPIRRGRPSPLCGGGAVIMNGEQRLVTPRPRGIEGAGFLGPNAIEPHFTHSLGFALCWEEIEPAPPYVLSGSRQWRQVYQDCSCWTAGTVGRSSLIPW